jgi:hypothetical protein
VATEDPEHLDGFRDVEGCDFRMEIAGFVGSDPEKGYRRRSERLF